MWRASSRGNDDGINCFTSLGSSSVAIARNGAATATGKLCRAGSKESGQNLRCFSTRKRIRTSGAGIRVFAMRSISHPLKPVKLSSGGGGGSM